MSDNSLSVSGINYRIGRLDLDSQLNVAARIAPVLIEVVRAAVAVQSAAREAVADGQVFSLADQLGSFSAAAKAFNAMSDEDRITVKRMCLAVITRELPGGTGWAPVLAANGRLMYEDINLFEAITLCKAVIDRNLTSFFSGAGSSLTGLTSQKA